MRRGLSTARGKGKVGRVATLAQHVAVKKGKRCRCGSYQSGTEQPLGMDSVQTNDDGTNGAGVAETTLYNISPRPTLGWRKNSPVLFKNPRKPEG